MSESGIRESPLSVSQIETGRLRRRRRLLATAIRAVGVCVALACASLTRNHRQSRQATLARPSSGVRELLSEIDEEHVDRRWELEPSFEELTNIPVLDDEVDKCGSIINSQEDRCSYVREHCLDDGEGLLNFTVFHHCTMRGSFVLSFATLTLVVLLSFYLLGETAEEYFCPVVKKLTDVLDLAPNTAGVTFLAFGNGAPDVFSSLAAFLEGDGKIGLGAIVSAGSFVCAFVVGAVAIAAAPFSVYTGYTRDVVFYFVAVVLVFFVFSSGHIHMWQACSLVFYYCIFVVYVVWIDSVVRGRKAKEKVADMDGAELGHGKEGISSSILPHGVRQPGLSWRSPSGNGESKQDPTVVVETDGVTIEGNDQAVESSHGGFLLLWAHLKRNVLAWLADVKSMGAYEQVLTVVLQPFTLARRMTVPDVWRYDPLVSSINTMLCPLLVLLFFNDFVDFGMPVGVFGEGTVPLWSVVGLQSSMLATAQWVILGPKRRPMWMEHASLAASFICSIAWISMIAQELLSCLSTLGHIMGLSPAIMGVTVLAWGNSIGDLVADVALARSGEPVVALAGCYAGPMFNMLIGLGLSLCIKTIFMYPQPYGLHYDANVPVSFGYLFTALVSSGVVVTLSDYKITKAWGVCLVGLYLAAMVTSILVESDVIKL